MPDNVIANINGYARLRAPPQLSAEERRAFAEAVASVHHGHFEQGDLALLTEYARLVVLIGQLWAALRSADVESAPAIHGSITRTQKSLFTCCRLLRLSPSARAPNAPTRETQRRSAGRHRHSATGSFYDQLEAADE